MSLVFAAIVSESTTALNLQSTGDELEAELYATKPDTLIVVSATTSHVPSFSINLAENYSTSLNPSGQTYHGNTGLGYRLKEANETKLPVRLTSQPDLESPVASVVNCLLAHLPTASLVPIASTIKNSETNTDFGQALAELLNKTNERVAVLAITDMTPDLVQQLSAAAANLSSTQTDQPILSLVMGLLTDTQYHVEILPTSSANDQNFPTVNFKI